MRSSAVVKEFACRVGFYSNRTEDNRHTLQDLYAIKRNFLTHKKYFGEFRHQMRSPLYLADSRLKQ